MADCSTCQFWAAVDQVKELGRCRRFPPSATGNMNTQWPQVEPTDWCGEHQAIELPPPEADEPELPEEEPEGPDEPDVTAVPADEFVVARGTMAPRLRKTKRAR